MFELHFFPFLSRHSAAYLTLLVLGSPRNPAVRGRVCNTWLKVGKQQQHVLGSCHLESCILTEVAAQQIVMWAEDLLY